MHRHCIAYDTDEPASSRSEREVVFLLRQILEGLKHMHDQDYVHLDIKVSRFDIVLELYMFPNVCLGLNFREGVVTLQDLGKHSTVDSLSQTNSINLPKEDPCLLCRSCVISDFKLLVLHFFLHARTLNICIEI